MNQIELNLAKGERLKAEGIGLVTWHTEADWLVAFDRAGRIIASLGKPFTSEDILVHVGKPPGSQNAIGAAMSALAKKLKLVPCGYVKSQRPSRHGAVVASWRKE